MSNASSLGSSIVQRNVTGQIVAADPESEAQVTTKKYVDDKLNNPILKDFTLTQTADNVLIKNDDINLNTAEETSQTKTLDVASDTTVGLMSTSDYKSIRDLQARVGHLEGKTTIILYTEKTNPSRSEIQLFINSLVEENSEPLYTSPYEGITVVVDETFHIWRYYENDNIGWRDDGQDTVHQFTNETKGIILGSSEDGKIYAETDGTGSVNGWSNLVQRVTDTETNISENYVKFTDYASNSKVGVVKGNPSLGIWVNPDNGTISVLSTEEDLIDAKTDQYRPITPKQLDYAIKSGLTTNALEWTDNEKTSARTLIDAVGNQDFATSDKAGLVSIPSWSGLYISTKGEIWIKEATDTQIKSKSEVYTPVTTSKIDLAVKTGMTTNVLE